MKWLGEALVWSAKNWGPVVTIGIVVLLAFFLWWFGVDVPGLLDRVLGYG